MSFIKLFQFERRLISSGYILKLAAEVPTVCSKCRICVHVAGKWRSEHL